MLEPIQLEHVLVCYRDDVGTLRRLLARVHLPLDSGLSLPAVVVELEKNRSFRRDLSLHVASMAHTHGQNVSPGDLLGIVALAAAGAAHAATADQAVAHTLLNFLMEECDRQQVKVAPHVRSERFYWGIAKLVAASTACILLITFGLLIWITDSDKTKPVMNVAEVPSLSTRVAQQGELTNLFDGTVPRHIAAKPAPGKSPQMRQFLSHLLARTGIAVTTATAAPIFRDEIKAPAVPNLSSIPVATAAPPGKVVTTTSAASQPNPAGNVPIPTAVLSQRLGARSIPADAYDEDRSYDSHAPRLLRRPPLSHPAINDESNLLASNEPAPIFRAGDADSRIVAAGTVRPVSLGIMAGNLLYSPAPAYPAAASVAHVQGSVRVQAEVDRDGNVASVRAISGPPLLRNAAVDAVQRWRYKPYLSAGRPVSMSATAVMEFELP